MVGTSPTLPFMAARRWRISATVAATCMASVRALPQAPRPE
jgi:hypothetical protein